MAPPIINRVGKRYGRLFVRKYVGQGKFHNALWECVCDCGKVKVINAGHLNSGNVQSCGCLSSDSAIKRFTKHGLSRSRFYTIWASMRGRCLYPGTNKYENYGGRGIKILWKDFTEFTKDMYPSYLKHVAKFGEKNTQIDRRENDGHYCKSNCRWATLSEQSRNRRFGHRGVR